MCSHCLRVHMCVYDADTPAPVKMGISQRMELCMALRIAFRGAGVCCCRWTGIIVSADIYWKIPSEFVVVRIKSQCQA